MPNTTTQQYRDLISKVEHIVESIDALDRNEPTIERIAEAVTDALGEEMGLSGGRIYLRDEDSFTIWRAFGSAVEVPRGTVVPASYEPVRNVLRHGVVYAMKGDPTLDPRLESTLGAEGFVAAVLGSQSEYLLAFDVTPDHDPDRVIFSMELLRHFIGSKIRQERMEDLMLEARRIQTSILPQEAPKFGPFDIFGRQDSLESVGGDFYDFIPLSEKIVGLAIADATGHGLPAAMQVRDIYTGLRMGMSRDFKIIRTMERLNQIINGSALSGRFVSLFYGELETTGTFIYCNAGHPAPIHVKAEGEVRFLEEGGVVLGPLPNANYTRGYLTLMPGEVLVFYTDGIVETMCECEGEIEEYGVDRLVEVVQAHRQQSSAQIVHAIFSDVEAYCESTAASDDRTLAVVRYPFEEGGSS
jgi:sigma-B regulation protein RsbU (phosphoserine phosphatase)